MKRGMVFQHSSFRAFFLLLACGEDAEWRQQTVEPELNTKEASLPLHQAVLPSQETGVANSGKRFRDQGFVLLGSESRSRAIQLLSMVRSPLSFV